MPFTKGQKQLNTGRTHFKKGEVAWNKNIPMSDTQKKKISISKRGQTSWSKGKRLPYVSERNRVNNPQKRGALSSTWKGGKDIYLKRQSLARDNYTCQICGLCEPEIMVVDHIKPKSIFPELRYEMNNLMTLCPNCHARKTIREKKRKYERSLYE